MRRSPGERLSARLQEQVFAPYADKMLEGRAESMIEVEAKQLRLEVTGDIQNIKIEFPFPYCTKKL